jgi:tetratricopeptide (TPR) repeat protein
MTQDAAKSSLLGKVAIYTELLDKDPCSSIFVPLSDVYRQLGMLEKAVEIVQKGILENPAFAEGYVAYSRILIKQRLFDEAVGKLETALILDGNRLTAIKLLAKIRFNQGDFKSAQSLLRRAAEIKSDDSSIRKILELVEQKLAETAPVPTAQATVMSVPEAVPEPKTAPVLNYNEKLERVSAPISTATIAEIYIRQGFPEKALKVYRDLLRADPLNEYLREKLVQLKTQIDSGEQPVPEEAAIADNSFVAVDEAPVQIAPAIQGVDSAQIAVGRDVEPVDEPAGRSLVDMFNGWLDAISSRREAHVR